VPLVYAVVGNPEFQAEQLTEIEGGYRVQVGSNAAFDVALFRGSYDGLSSLEPLEPSFQSSPRPHVLVPLQFGNLLAASAAGIEVAAHWMPLSWWRLDGSYSGFRATSRLDAAGQGTAAESFDGDAPRHQWQIHSSLWPTTRTQVDVSLYHVGGQRLDGAEAYTRSDARAEFKISERLSAIATGQNLLEPTHDEYTAGIFVGSAVVPRSGTLSMTWKF
jgi:outer membrane receptor protein involved in Fe transport